MMNRLFLVFGMLLAVGLAGWAQDVDMGDLPACDYPTLVNNPGHYLSGVAWLGDSISGEAAPNILNQDPYDDGVTFLNTPWTPCTWVSVRVKVTAGPFYPIFRVQGDHLYLNAWKDGNHDGDFCDTLCNGQAPEWIIQDVVVTPGEAEYRFLDPGVTNMGWYEGVFRFRLTDEPLGPFGFGAVNEDSCPDMTCGTYSYCHLGEVEDYIIPDMQLAVELDHFDATPGDGLVRLSWVTVSESDLDHFELERDGHRIADVQPRGTGPSGASYSFVDAGLNDGQCYFYTLSSVDIGGTQQVLSTASATPVSQAVAVTEYALHQNYPNPFNAVTKISFDMKEAGLVSIKVYNMEGRLVAVPVQGNLDRGHHEVYFNAAQLSSALYICRMETAGFVAERKIVLLK
jgi:hypothetical protein